MCIFGIAGSIVQAAQARKQEKAAEAARKQAQNLQRNQVQRSVNQTASTLQEQNTKEQTIGTLRIPYNKTNTQLEDSNASDTALGLNIPT